MKKIVVAVTGASGAIYAKLLLTKLIGMPQAVEKVALLLSENAKMVLDQERVDLSSITEDPKVSTFENNDYYAPFASGSSKDWHMAIIPTSMGTLGKIASGIANDLIGRAADVMLKERRRLVLVPREMPFNLVHLENMQRLTRAGAIVCSACPTFYNINNRSVEEICSTVSDKVLDLLGLESKAYKWQE